MPPAPRSTPSSYGPMRRPSSGGVMPAVGTAGDSSSNAGPAFATLHHRGHGGHRGQQMGLHAAITEKILAAALKVHTQLGAGCLESTYGACLCYQLTTDGMTFAHQVR